MNKIMQGDCLEVMDKMPPASIDTIICDPPYGLKFMGKGWDHGVPGIPFWEAALRVAKPGAFLLAFGGTRTYHRLACAIEDAGWKLRDCMMWIFGSGFSKGHNISKAIDKAAGAEREKIKADANKASAYFKNFGNTRPWMNDPEHKIDSDIPVTEQAKLWDGWNVSLKPAYEPIIIAMKELDGTFAKNALKHGVAGLAVGKGRIGDEKRVVQSRKSKFKNVYNNFASRGGGSEHMVAGRWPTNVIIDEEAGALIDQQSGHSKSTKLKHNPKPSNRHGEALGLNTERSKWIDGISRSHTDSGGASRFFYTAKASPGERAPYNNHPTVKPLALMRHLCKLTSTPTGGVVLDPFAGSGSTLVAAVWEDRPYIGIELNPDYVKIAQKRVAEAEAQMNGLTRQEARAEIKQSTLF